MRLIPGLNEQTALEVMCERVELPHRVGMKIWYWAKMSSLRQGRPIDMVLVANAIKYASLPENIWRVKKEYMEHSN